MKLSIIIPVYNTALYLKKCFDSVLNQNFNDFEALLIDDGSTDDSPRICDEYAKKDKRFKVFHVPNAGVSSARNLGLDKAQGEYIGFIDSDDYIHPDRYKLAIEVADKHKADLVQCGIVNIFPDGREVIPQNTINNSGKVKTKTPRYPGSTVVKILRRSFINDHDIRFYTKSKYAEDTAFMSLFYAYHPIMYCVRDVLYYRNVRDESAQRLAAQNKETKTNQLLNQLYTLCKNVVDLKERKVPNFWVERVSKYINNILNIIDNL